MEFSPFFVLLYKSNFDLAEYSNFYIQVISIPNAKKYVF